MLKDETIIALSTAPGIGAIAVIRLSGNKAISIVNDTFVSSVNPNKKLKDQKSHTVHLGTIYNGNRIIDEVLITLFKNPHSYTGEDVVEISCHGSHYIQQQILQLYTQKGLRLAEAGEFTLRSFVNGKMDLSQAEAVADLIASDSKASHKVAIQQMRGGFTEQLKQLREELIHFASLIELELDFSEEDIEFANRDKLMELVNHIKCVLKKLIDSFALGNVIKNGIAVTIVGKPNAGKSTLLNAILKEEKAIVSNIAGTTRDIIEDEITLGGIKYRFIDTAGIRETYDEIEKIGVEKTFKKIADAKIVLYLVDATKSKDAIKNEIQVIQQQIKNQHLIVLINKTDLSKNKFNTQFDNIEHTLYISAKENKGIEELLQLLENTVKTQNISTDTVVSNVRHYQSLMQAYDNIQRVQEGIEYSVTHDLIATDIRATLHHIGLITGEVVTDDLLDNIFSNFCIGK